MDNAILIHPADNVAIARVALKPGEKARGVELREPVRALQKISLVRIPAGAPVIRYGTQIGVASADIEPGSWVHTQNLAFHPGQQDYRFASEQPPIPPIPQGFTTFEGYRRQDGRVGTRKYLAVISTVNCSGHVPPLVRDRFRTIREDYPGIDGILAISHQTGCGITMGNESHRTLQRTFANLAKHPNIAGLVFVGLGCEQLDPSGMVGSKLIQLNDLTVQGGQGRPLPTVDDGPLLVSLQSHGGTEKTVNEVCRYLQTMIPRVAAIKRTPIPLSEIILGTNCGGSDAFSGITANPAVGAAVDMLVALGASAVLAETPETAGAEHILTRRARTKEVGEELVRLIKWWEAYYAAHTFLHPTPSLDNNPSVGNKDGGLTTITEKSMGAVAKAGTTMLNHVLQYGALIPRNAGLCFMDTPGKDSSSMTGLVSGGANIGVFTTGRGNMAGWAPAPTIKICTNTPTFMRLEGDMDLNAGGIIDGTHTIQDVGFAILAMIRDVASGHRTRSEILGADTSCFDPWYFGASV